MTTTLHSISSVLGTMLDIYVIYRVPLSEVRCQGEREFLDASIDFLHI